MNNGCFQAPRPEGAFDGQARAVGVIQEYEARIAAVERLASKEALELEFLKGLWEPHRGRAAELRPSLSVPQHLYSRG
jgi:hypothetical protein